MVSVAVFFVVIVAGFLCVVFQPGSAFAYVLCMFGLEQWAQGSHSFFLVHNTVTNLAIGGMVLSALFIKLIKGRGLFANYPSVSKLIIVLFVYAFVSAYWAPRPDLSLGLWYGGYPYIVIYVLLAPLLLQELEDFDAAFRTLVVLGTAIIFLLLFTVEWRNRNVVFAQSVGGQIVGGNPLAPAQMASSVIFAALFVHFRRFVRFYGIMKWGIVAAGLALIVRTGSRGQLFSTLFVISAFWFINKPRVHVVHMLLGGLLIGGLGWFTKFALDLYWGGTFEGNRRFSESNMTEQMSGRFDNALFMLNHWLDSGIGLIVGMGNSAAYDPKLLGIYPHFVPAEILTEEGLLGFFLFVLIIYSAVKSAIRVYREFRQDDLIRARVVIIAGMFVNAFLLCLKQGSMIGNLELFMTCIMLGSYERILFRETPVKLKRGKANYPNLLASAGSRRVRPRHG